MQVKNGCKITFQARHAFDRRVDACARRDPSPFPRACLPALRTGVSKGRAVCIDKLLQEREAQEKISDKSRGVRLNRSRIKPIFNSFRYRCQQRGLRIELCLPEADLTVSC